MHTNYYKIVKELKSFKIIIVAPTCVSVYINQHQGALSLCFAKVTMLTSVTYLYLKLPILWLLHISLNYRATFTRNTYIGCFLSYSLVQCGRICDRKRFLEVSIENMCLPENLFVSLEYKIA